MRIEILVPDGKPVSSLPVTAMNTMHGHRGALFAVIGLHHTIAKWSRWQFVSSIVDTLNGGNWEGGRGEIDGRTPAHTDDFNFILRWKNNP